MPPWWREVCLWDLRCAECFVALLRLFSTFFIEQLLLLNRAVATVPSLVKIVWLLRLTKITLRARRTVSLSYLFPWLTVLQSQWQSGIREIFAFGIQNLGLWSLQYSSRNPEFHCRLKSEIHVSLTKNRKFSTWNPKSIAWNPESKIPLQTFTWGSLLLMNFKHISDRWTDHVFTER